MLLERKMKCDLWNYELYLNGKQRGMFVLPSKGIRVGAAFSLLEFNYKSESYTGRSIECQIADVKKVHHNKLLHHLWFIKCLFLKESFALNEIPIVFTKPKMSAKQ